MITEKQKEARKGKIGSSDAPVALGLSRFKTPARYFAELRGEIEPDPVPETNSNLGNNIEPIIAEEYTRLTGIETEPFPGDETWVFEGNKNLIAHPDRQAADRIVEIKSVGPRMAFDFKDTGNPDYDVPDYHIAQIMHQLLCSNGKYLKVDLVAFFGGADLRIFPFEFKPEEIRSYQANIEKFWSWVEAGEYPKMRAKDTALTQRLYVRGGSNPIEANPDITEKMREFTKTKDLVDRLTKQNEAIKAEVQFYMKGHDTLVDATGNVLATWRNDRDGKKVDWKGLCNLIAENVDPKIFEKKLEAFTSSKVGQRKFLGKLKLEEE